MADHTYDRGGAPDGVLTVEIFRFYGEDTVTLDLQSGSSAAHLTARQARAVARDLLAHADQLDGGLAAIKIGTRVRALHGTFAGEVGVVVALASQTRRYEGLPLDGWDICVEFRNGGSVARSAFDAGEVWSEQISEVTT